MNVCATLARSLGLLVCLSSCMNAGPSAPVVVEEPLREVKVSGSKAGLRVFDRSCDADSAYDPGCALGSLPVYELPHCSGTDHAAMPVLVLPQDVSPYDCSVEVRSLTGVPMTFDPAWRSTCSQLDDGSSECSGVPVVAALTPNQELDPPGGVQSVLVLSCAGFADESRPLVMSRKTPMAGFFSRPLHCSGH
jgi:hypothetical protein